MTNRNTHLLGEMNIHKALIKLSIPATIGMLVNALYNLVDSLFVGWSSGEIAIGALTLAFPIQMIVMAVGLMIGIGGASVFSRAYGRKDKETMDKSINSAIRFDIITSLIIVIIGFIFIEDILVFFEATNEMIGFARDYLSIILIGLVPLTLSMVLNNFTRAEGRAKMAMISMALGAGLNILLDPIFIFDWGLGLGVKGAAIATVLSQIVAFVFIFLMSFSEKSVLNITFKKPFEINWKVLKEILTVGVPTFFRNAVGAIVAVGIIKMIAIYTTDIDRPIYIAIFGVINRVSMFILMPGFGIVQGMSPLAGYNFGAKKYDRLKDLIIYATKILLIYFICGFLFIQLGASLIFDIFSEDNNALFINKGADIFRIYTIGYFVICFQIILGSVYQAFGYAKRAIFISLLRQFIFFAPIMIILTSIFKLEGLWFAFALSDILSGGLSLVILVYEINVLNKKIEEKSDLLVA